MSGRRLPPNRRPATTFTVAHDGQEYFVTVGQHWTPGQPDALGFYDVALPPCEVFVQCKRSSSALEAVARDAAIIASYALQYGAPVPNMASSMSRDANGKPLSVVGAVLDAVLREFPDSHERFNPPPAPPPIPAPSDFRPGPNAPAMLPISGEAAE